MKLHEGAATCPRCRMLIVRRVFAGRSIASTARDFDVSPPTMRKWLRRYRQAGREGLSDRSCRPLHLPARKPKGSSSLIRNAVLPQVADRHMGVSLTAQLSSHIQIAVIVSAVFYAARRQFGAGLPTVCSESMNAGPDVRDKMNNQAEERDAYTVIKAAVLLYVLFGPEANAYFGRPWRQIGRLAGLLPRAKLKRNPAGQRNELPSNPAALPRMGTFQLRGASRARCALLTPACHREG